MLNLELVITYEGSHDVHALMLGMLYVNYVPCIYRIKADFLINNLTNSILVAVEIEIFEDIWCGVLSSARVSGFNHEARNALYSEIIADLHLKQTRYEMNIMSSVICLISNWSSPTKVLTMFMR